MNYTKFNEGLILARITQILNKDWLWKELHKDYGNTDSGTNYTKIQEWLSDELYKVLRKDWLRDELRKALRKEWLRDELHKDSGKTDSGTKYTKIQARLTQGRITQCLMEGRLTDELH